MIIAITMLMLMVDPNNCGPENFVDSYDHHFGEGHCLQLIARYWLKEVPNNTRFTLLFPGDEGYDPACVKYNPPEAWLSGDLTEDGIVNMEDLCVWASLKYKYSEPPPKPQPEPKTGIFTLMSMLAERWVNE